MKQVKPILSLEIMRQIVQTLRCGEPSTMRRQLLITLEFSLTKMLELEAEKPSEQTK